MFCSRLCDNIYHCWYSSFIEHNKTVNGADRPYECVVISKSLVPTPKRFRETPGAATQRYWYKFQHGINGNNGKTVLWNDIKEICVEKANPYSLKLRTSLNNNTGYQIVKVIII